LLVAAAGSWLAVLWLVCSPLRRWRDFPAETGPAVPSERARAA
jgi:hypothetical protein